MRIDFPPWILVSANDKTGIIYIKAQHGVVAGPGFLKAGFAGKMVQWRTAIKEKRFKFHSLSSIANIAWSAK
jgi:stalled ribosome rescue protein Dom34